MFGDSSHIMQKSPVSSVGSPVSLSLSSLWSARVILKHWPWELNSVLRWVSSSTSALCGKARVRPESSWISVNNRFLIRPRFVTNKQAFGYCLVSFNAAQKSVLIVNCTDTENNTAQWDLFRKLLTKVKVFLPKLANVSPPRRCPGSLLCTFPAEPLAFSALLLGRFSSVQHLGVLTCVLQKEEARGVGVGCSAWQPPFSLGVQHSSTLAEVSREANTLPPWVVLDLYGCQNHPTCGWELLLLLFFF